VQKLGKPRAESVKGQAVALVIIRIAAGIAIFFFGFHRAGWLIDAAPLTAQLSAWLPTANVASRWYLERVLPGAPVFARLIPAGAMLGGIALVLGCWTRMAAGLCLLVVLSVEVAEGSIFRYAFLAETGRLTLAAVLLGLMIGGGRLPLSLRK
jgi:uncharacterized membrane protein YphA (DoxX/SURF4 family)